MDELRDRSALVITRTCPADLPGHPRDRENAVASLFCKQVLKREFNRKLQVCKYDFSHTTPELDTTEPTVRRWFICDLNVTRELTRDEVLSLHHEVYSISLQNCNW
jgi:hypothetical protein